MYKEYLTTTEACEYLSISRSTWYAQQIASKVPSYKVGKTIKYKRSELDKALRLPGRRFL